MVKALLQEENYKTQTLETFRSWRQSAPLFLNAAFHYFNVIAETLGEQLTKPDPYFAKSPWQRKSRRWKYPSLLLIKFFFSEGSKEEEGVKG